VVFADSPGPFREAPADFRQDYQPLIEFDAMTLPVVKSDGLDRLEAVEGPSQAGGGILAAGEQDQSGARIDHWELWPATFCRGMMLEL
jgi:hypothetical protein